MPLGSLMREISFFTSDNRLQVRFITPSFSDRDAKQRWANSAAWNFGIGGIGGQLLGSAVKSSVGRVFGSG